jgi:hypothetical protein
MVDPAFLQNPLSLLHPINPPTLCLHRQGSWKGRGPSVDRAHVQTQNQKKREQEVKRILMLKREGRLTERHGSARSIADRSLGAGMRRGVWEVAELKVEARPGVES